MARTKPEPSGTCLRLLTWAYSIPSCCRAFASAVLPLGALWQKEGTVWTAPQSNTGVKQRQTCICTHIHRFRMFQRHAIGEDIVSLHIHQILNKCIRAFPVMTFTQLLKVLTIKLNSGFHNSFAKQAMRSF